MRGQATGAVVGLGIIARGRDARDREALVARIGECNGKRLRRAADGYGRKVMLFAGLRLAVGGITPWVIFATKASLEPP